MDFNLLVNPTRLNKALIRAFIVAFRECMVTFVITIIPSNKCISLADAVPEIPDTKPTIWFFKYINKHHHVGNFNSLTSSLNIASAVGLSIKSWLIRWEAVCTSS
jgi:hypothetical protein